MGLSRAARGPIITVEVHMPAFSPELLRTARTLAGLTAAELAERAGLHRVSVSTFERGLVPAPETWLRIEKALLVALNEQTRAVAKVQRRLRAA
jgi:transcriptional regulator with XRE-family HTH domain